MECLSTISFQTILPRFVQNLFTRKDDASFWGGEEDLDPTAHYVNTPYARTRTVKYEVAHKDLAVSPNEPEKQIWSKSTNSRQAEQSSASKSRCRAATSQSDETIDSGVIELPSLPAGIHFPTRGRILMEANEDDLSRDQTPSKWRPFLEYPSGERQVNGSGITHLNIALLAEVKEFRYFGGMMYNHNTVDSPDILLAVLYHNGTHEIVRCGSWVHGRPRDISDLFRLHLKITEAKELVPWKDLKGVKRDKMLRIERPLLF